MKGMKTWKKVKSSQTNKPLPLMWVFTYKFDSDGYLHKFKARLVVRGNLHVPNKKDTYTATLVLRIFRALMAITAYFNLEIK